MGLAVPFAAVLCPARGRQPRIFIKPMIVMNLKAGLRARDDRIQGDAG